MNIAEEERCVAFERKRVLAAYSRREEELSPDLYAHWQPAEILMRFGRKRTAAAMLREANLFPVAGDKCLEIGYGSMGWLGDLISWGVREADLHGVEIDGDRAKRAQELLPLADLRVGDASRLPWPTDTFRLVIASTVFTSILDADFRHLLADEVTRVLAPRGALLWYDFAVNNPKNPHVRRVDRNELKRLFPTLERRVKSVTLAPPLARFIARRSWTLATCMEALPFLRTHLLGVMIKIV